MQCKYNWKEIEKYIDKHSVREAMQEFGFSSGAYQLALDTKKIEPKARGKTIEELLATDLIENSTYNPALLKIQVIKHNLVEYRKCAICGCDPIWQNKPLVFILDHINGVKTDNRIQNLRFVCPNCDTQLPTFKGRNINNKLKTKNI